MNIRGTYDSHERVQTAVGEESRTKQSMLESTDVNYIVEKFVQTGMLPPVLDEKMYADVSEIGDYRSALEQVRAADDVFMQLPSQVRAQFSNDPAEFLDALQDVDRVDELAALGFTRDSPVESEAPAEEPALAEDESPAGDSAQ